MSKVSLPKMTKQDSKSSSSSSSSSSISSSSKSSSSEKTKKEAEKRSLEKVFYLLLKKKIIYYCKHDITWKAHPKPLIKDHMMCRLGLILEKERSHLKSLVWKSRTVIPLRLLFKPRTFPSQILQTLMKPTLMTLPWKWVLLVWFVGEWCTISHRPKLRPVTRTLLVWIPQWPRFITIVTFKLCFI